MSKFVAFPTVQFISPNSSRGVLPFITVAQVPDNVKLIKFNEDYVREFDFLLERHHSVINPTIIDEPEINFTLVEDRLSGEWLEEMKGIYKLITPYILLYRTDISKITKFTQETERPKAKFPSIVIKINLGTVSELKFR